MGGAPSGSAERAEKWIPAFAGMTGLGCAASRDFDRVVLDDRVGRELPAHLLDPGAGGHRVGLGELELDQLALAHFADIDKAESFQCVADRLALRIEHPRLQADMDARLHRSAI